MLGSAGFVIRQLAEPRASEEVALANSMVADTRVAPIFLQVLAGKST